MKNLISLSLIFAAALSLAQNYQGKIKPASQSGLHQLLVTPEVRSASKDNLDFLRIFDSKNNEVPYALFQKKTNKNERKNLSIVSKTAIANVATSVIISNQNLQNLDNITLTIANTDVDKKYNISGSNDQQEWFGLVSNQLMTNLNEQGKTSVERNFSFPLNHYKFLKFDFIDKNSLPINIISANLEEDQALHQASIELKNFTQETETDKKLKKTKITISFPTPQVVDGIRFGITSPSYYLRNARILVIKPRKPKQNTGNYEEVTAFQLDSKKKNHFSFSPFLAKNFIIEIDNMDNPALTIDKTSPLQSPISIVADLKANENYHYSIDSTLAAPQYDLASSGIDFSQNFPIAAFSDLKKVDDAKPTEKPKSFWQTSMFMWSCIVLAIVIIAYFALGLIKDLGKENQ